MTLAEKIAAIPGGEGWWHSDGQSLYEELAQDLVARGYSEGDAVDLLASAYGAAAAEFGD
ncbi:hypothetical protein [Acrocarpospora sp. B8E8]|uniref:hypothetical protein n=1 Tax=Acrocarpospora sp. B8E8 TaxID=3153572 RepID=UPI00325CFCEC